GVAAEGAGGRKLAQLVADHVLGDVDGNVAAPVVNGYRMPDEGREYRRGAAPGLQDLLLAGLVELIDALQQLGSGEGAFLYASAHLLFPSLLRVAALDDELIGRVLRLTGLVAQRRLAPRSDGAGTAD